MPVTTTAATVTGTTPPSCSEIPMAMGVVTDLGTRETVSVRSSPNALQSRTIQPTEATVPAAAPARMGSSCCFSRSNWE